MVKVYDDQQAIEANHESRGSIFHRDLVDLAILSKWAESSSAENYTLKKVIENIELLHKCDTISIFFDVNGAYVGHVVAVGMKPFDPALVVDRDEVVNRSERRTCGGVGWVTHFEARNGAALAIARRFRTRISGSAGKLQYARRHSRGAFIRSWRVDPCSDLRPQAAPSGTNRELGEIFNREAETRREKMAVISLLAEGDDRSLREAVQLTNWAVNLGQYQLDGEKRTLLIWAWFDQPAVERTLRQRKRVPADPEWNCGRIPVLISAIGDGLQLETSIARWKSTLPRGSAAPVKLRSGSSREGFGLDAL